MKKIPILYLFFMFLTVCYGHGQQPMEKTFSGIEEIEMSISSGDVTFDKSQGTAVEIKMQHTYDFDYQPVIKKTGDRLTIKEDRKTMPNSYSGSAEWTILIPNDSEIEFNTGSGDIEISNVNVECEMNSGSGDFDLQKGFR